MVKWAVLAILLLPFIELGIFALVASAIGIGWALALALATSVAGLLILKAAGRGQLVQLRVAATDSDLAAFQALAGGAQVVLGGFLLLLPGFLTDAIGALLLLAPVRRWSESMLRRAAARRERAQSEDVVDLAPDEWARVPDPRLEHRRPETARPTAADRPEPRE